MQGAGCVPQGSSTILPAVEQRIGSSSQPLEGAGFDPAFIPGLKSPTTAKPEDPTEVGEPDADEKAVDEETVDAKAVEGETVDAEAVEGEAADAEAADGEIADGDAVLEGPSDGPVFEAADRRAKIVADARGVHLTLDDQQCEFRWDEVGAVETETARFGKRFTLTVHTPDRRWYPIEIEATARSEFKKWEDALDAVLDAYFDENAE